MFEKLSKKKQSQRLLTYDEKYLLEELIQTKNALEIANSNFENAVDPDLIDCCIYQVNSAQIKYKFLLEKAKAANLSVSVPLNLTF